MKRLLLVVLLISLLALTAFSASAQTSGGTIVVAASLEPTTLDAQKAPGSALLSLIGATLVALDPKTNAVVPYLASNWKVSDDGLTWEFTLRDGVMFHDGAPLTADDYAWTFNRWLNPDTKSPTVAAYSAIKSAEAVDAHTLRLNLAAPFAPLLHNLATGFAQPLERKAVEAEGDQYGLHPVGVGPFKFKEWVPGEKLVLERNPDFNWAPPFLHQGAPYVDQVEFRFIPEYATTLAGLEAGEIDTLLGVTINPRDLPALQDAKFTIQNALVAGMQPFVLMNVSKPPFDDLRVRQAFNYAVNRDALIAAAAGGAAIPQYGPISKSVAGYSAETEQIGYHYDLDKAKALLAQAGYADSNGDGILDKDGQPFALTMYLTADYATVAQVLQDQYKQLGVQIDLQQQDFGSLFGAAVGGQYQIAVGFYNYDEADVMFIFYNSGSLGALNVSQVNDPKLDEILTRTRTSTDPAARQAAVDEAQRYIIEQAYTVPLYTPQIAIPISPRVKGIIFSADGSDIYLNDAQIAQ